MNESKYSNLVGLLKSDILSGKYGLGKPLPSIRALVRRFGCSGGTAQCALDELFHLGFVSRRQGSMYISSDPFRSPSRRDTSGFGKAFAPSAYLVWQVGTTFDPTVEHTLEIRPVFKPGAKQEFRLGSICVAGRDAATLDLTTTNKKVKTGWLIDWR